MISDLDKKEKQEKEKEETWEKLAFVCGKTALLSAPLSGLYFGGRRGRQRGEGRGRGRGRGGGAPGQGRRCSRARPPGLRGSRLCSGGLPGVLRVAQKHVGVSRLQGPGRDFTLALFKLHLLIVTTLRGSQVVRGDISNEVES